MPARPKFGGDRFPPVSERPFEAITAVYLERHDETFTDGQEPIPTGSIKELIDGPKFRG